MITISKADINDLADIQQLSQELFDDNFHYDPLLKKDWSFTAEGREHFSKTLTDKSYVLFKAVDNNKIIGYLSGHIRDDSSSRPVKTADIINLIVSEKYQKQGIGALLGKKFNSWCLRRKVKSVIVTTYSQNTKAINFYRKNGFQDLSVRLEKRL